MAQSTPDAKQLVRDYAEMWSDHDASRIPDIVSESFRGELPKVQTLHGQEDLEAYMNEFTAAFPDFQVEITDMIASGDMVMAEGIYTMTHEGEFNGIPPTEREVEIRAMTKFRIEDGKIQEHWDYHDRQEMLEQLGVTGEQ
jgi:steroid delta-isomerase-like uncharacterized protein